MISDLVDLPFDYKRTNIAGTQLPTGQAESQITGGQPVISRFIEGGWGAPSICKGLVSPHCLLELGLVS